MAATLNCVICGKQGGSFYGGHVHRRIETGEETIIARFCSDECLNTPTQSGCKGCHGKWVPIFGYDPAFGRLAYIDSAGMHELDDDEL